jgi:predicted Fe-Mo cluster-binding NifX family protein
MWIHLFAGIGGGAKRALEEAGIRLYGGVSGSADKAVESLLKGELEYDSDTECGHHGEHHGEDCGQHGCGGQHHAHGEW